MVRSSVIRRRKEAKSLSDVKTSLLRIDASVLERGMGRIFASNQTLRPHFSSSWVVLRPAGKRSLVKQYRLEDSIVELHEIDERTESLYRLIPYEYTLSENTIILLNKVKRALQESVPKGLNFFQPIEARNYLRDLSFKLIQRGARQANLRLGETREEEMREVERLAQAIVRHTIGLGVCEILLKDENIQDLYIDAPSMLNAIHLTLRDIGDERLHQRCITNIYLTENSVNSILSRLRYHSGRPFSEALPVLETDLDFLNTRATVIGRPLSPQGLAIALRRHSTEPWTLLRLMNKGSLDAMGAGLLSFLIDGKSTILVAGSRGAGKSSLLGAMMLEFPRSQRILTIEDTLELPCRRMQELGFKVQSLFVRSALGGRMGMTTDDALRVSLRLGESAIILGEVRGREARTLYEAMRAGTAGSAVMGTIHGNSARDVRERIVHDLGIPPKSFEATDVVVVTGLTRPGGTQRQKRRVTEIAEFCKQLNPTDFRSLMEYDYSSDGLSETEVLRISSERVHSISESWGITYEQALRDIEVRADYRQMIIDTARKEGKKRLLSAEWVVLSNAKFWSLKEKGLDPEEVLQEWVEWFERRLRYV